jgi:hypothetical protein
MIDWRIDWSMLLMEIIEWKFIYILLDLTRNSCKGAVLQPTEVHRLVVKL